MKKGMVTSTIMACVLTTAILGFLYWNGDILLSSGAEVNMTTEEKIASIPSSKLSEQTVAMEGMTTNLKDGNYVRLAFSLLADDPKTAEEVEARSFQIQDYLIETMANTSSEEIESNEGTKKITDGLNAFINGNLSKGEVLQVYVTDKVVN